MQFVELGLAGLAAAVCAWALVAVWIRVSVRARILDVPNARSSHAKVTPRAGGVGIVATVLVGVVIAIACGRAGDPSGALWAGGLALFIAVISFIDDVRSLPSLVRLVCQIGAAALAVWALGSFSALTVPFVEPILLPRWLGVLVTVVWIVGLTNVYNFMDGIDGIAGGQGFVAALGWVWFGVVFDASLVLWAALLVAASCAGFLVHNWSPAKVFMGDVGSAFLGFVFSVLPLLALRDDAFSARASLASVGSMLVFAALLVWPFIADGTFTFVRRLKHRENVFAAHRSHLYQRLTIAGWPHAVVTRLYIWWALGSVVFGALYLRMGHVARLVVLVAAVVTLVTMYRVVKAAEKVRGGRGSEGVRE